MNEIKDMTPNQETIDQLESLLKDAKEGKVRTVFYLAGWEDDSVSTGWSFDQRNGTLRLLGRLSLAKAEIESAMLVSDPDTDLRHAIEGWL